MVMPRAFSSGALSMLSKDRNTIFGLCFCNTLVMAAVSVVLPWSMWPIVPTFTCGLVRSNFSFAINLPCLACSFLSNSDTASETWSSTSALRLRSWTDKTRVSAPDRKALTPDIGFELWTLPTSRRSAQRCLGQHGLEVTHPGAVALHPLEELFNLLWRERA